MAEDTFPDMASAIEVKEYLAYWFQLGKGVIMPKSQRVLLPNPVFEGERFSAIFEEYWKDILSSSEDCYLDGTEQTIKELLTAHWEIVNCGRCSLPIPANHGHPFVNLCPCADMPMWPNLDLPLPRLPISDRESLSRLQCRLREKEKREDEQTQNMQS
ncbi:MAG: hypothetical protein VKJ02_16965 [Snowella sp.]|nr:hypothetical protein [Snowella sp.]